MAINLVVGNNGAVASKNKKFSDIPATVLNTRRIIRVGNPNASWEPNRLINAISEFEVAKGYYINMLQEVDWSDFLIPPLVQVLPTICLPVTDLVLEIRTIIIYDFAFEGNDIVWNGYYTGNLLPADVTLNMTQGRGAGLAGPSGTLLMPVGTNRFVNAMAALPPLVPLYQWQIKSLSPPTTKDYLALSIRNNQASSYKVGIRVAGSPDAFIYTTYQKQLETVGNYTRLLFDLPLKNYEASIISVCGPSSESVPFAVSNAVCPLPISFSVVRTDQEFHVSYTFASMVDEYDLIVDYPNGGVYTAQGQSFPAGGTIIVPVPPNIYGNYSFKIRAVCSVADQWFGPYSAPVTVQVLSAGSNERYVNAGWTDMIVTADNVETVPLTISSQEEAGSPTITVDFRSAPQYKYYVIQEDADQPVKIQYHNNLNVEPIPDYTFAAPVVKNSKRYYFTAGFRSFDSSAYVILSS